MKVKLSFNLVVYIDVSDIGYGGYCVWIGKNVFYGLWEEFERIMSFIWRELVVVDRVFWLFV